MRIHRPLKAVVLSIVAAVTATLLTGCGSDSPATPGATVYVHSARANTAALDAAQIPDLVALAHQSAERLDSVTVVTTDGQPTTSTALQLRNTGNSSTIRDKQDATNTSTILTAITQAPATTAEANPLRGIAIAADAIRHTTGPKQMVIIESGLETAPPLRFQDGLLAPGTDPVQVASFVQAVGAVPDLTGIDVTWIGIGQTQAPQAPLTTPATEKVKAIWDAILHAGNAANVTYLDSALPSATSTVDAPPVTLVPVPDLDSYASPQPAAAPISASFQADQLGFAPDLATFNDPDEAHHIIATTAAVLINGNYHQIHITGTTADSGPLDGQVRLATQRASAVRDLLITAGVNPADITDIQGVGSQFPGYIPDHNPDGTLNSTTAQLNRLVIITATT